MKNKLICIITAICTISVLSAVSALAHNDVVYQDDFNYNYLDECWRTETSTSCYVTVDNYEMNLTDNNDNTASPHYEGYAKAYRVFTPQYDKVTVSFFFNSDKIPVGHEVIYLNMGSTTAVEMVLNNHGQNSHVRLKEGDKYHMVPSLYAKRWHCVKLVVDLKDLTCEFYLDDLDECKIKTGLANEVDYIDRIVFSTGKELGEASTLKIDNLTVLGTKLKAQSIVSDKELNLNVGGEGYIKATVLPYEATEKDIMYSSSNEDVAVVDETGLVKAKREGQATITLQNADGVKAFCKVNALQSDMNVILNTSYENKKAVISGVSPYGTKPAALTVKDNTDNLIYFGYANCDNNGAFNTEIPYTSSADNTLKVDFKSGDAEKSAYIEYTAPVKKSSIKLDKELYVITFDGWQNVYRTIETVEAEEPNVQVTTSNKSVWYTGTPGGAIKFGLASVDGPNDIRILGNAEGDFILKVATIEDVVATDTALVQVNAREASVTEENTNEYRKISVSMKEEDLNKKISNGDMIRFAGGYAAFSPHRATLKSDDALFEVVKYNNPETSGIENALAKYKFSCDGNLDKARGKLELPLDYLSESIKDYDSLSVLISEDGIEWKNSGAYYNSEASSESLVMENITVPQYAVIVEANIPFVDISGHFAEKEIKKYYIRGILDGNEYFRPNDFITLDELSSLINKTHKSGEYAEKSNLPITREKAATVICELMKYNAVNTEKVIDGIKGFSDFEDVDTACAASMGMLCNSKVIQGDDTNSLRPKGYITRAEAVVIMERLK